MTFFCPRCQWGGPVPDYTDLSAVDQDGNATHQHAAICPSCGTGVRVSTPASRSMRDALIAIARVAACITLLIGAKSYAGDLPTARSAAGDTCYTSVQDAALAAIEAVIVRAARVEWGGAILVSGSCFTFTPAVTTRQVTAVNFKIEYAPGQQLAGIYHTHARTPSSDRFSDTDAAVVRQANVPSFIGVAEDRSVRILTPADALVATRMPSGALVSR